MLSKLSWLADPNRDLRQLLHAMRNVESLEIHGLSAQLQIELAWLLSEWDGVGMVYLPWLKKLKFDVVPAQSPLMLCRILKRLSWVVWRRPKNTEENGHGLRVVIIYQSATKEMNRAFKAGMKKILTYSPKLVTVEGAR